MNDENLTIAFVGDIMPGGMFVRQGGVDDEVLHFLSNCDFRIGTLETAFGDGSRLCHKKNNAELGTIIYSPDECVNMLIRMKIDAVSLANNHSCDCDLEGLYHTIELLDRNGIKHFGAGHNAEEATQPLVLEHKGKTLCFLGYLKEYKYLYRGEAYRPTQQVGGVNIFDLNRVIEDVRKYKRMYDYVFVMPHWGKEGTAFPRLKEEREAHQIIEAGANGVIGSHAHIVQPVIKYHEGVIAMNLGNFAFPDRYIVRPRISYYPTDEELANQDIKVVNSFKIVDSLSYKRVSQKERLGMVLKLSLNGSRWNFTKYHTELTKNNMIVHRRKQSLKEVLLNLYISCLIKDKWTFLHRIHLKMKELLELF